MDQHQFDVKFSLRTKLLLSIVILLVLTIIFLNVSAVLLLKEDKRAYVYQQQATETVLAGGDFVNTSRHAIDTLRTALGQIDPYHPVTPAVFEGFATLLNNQSDVTSASIALLNVNGKIISITQYLKADDATALQLPEGEAAVPEDRLNFILPDLLKNSFAFLNLSRAGAPPALGIIVADLKNQTNTSGMPLIYGVVSLVGLADALHGKNVTVATRAGTILYDTDPAVYYARTEATENPLFGMATASKLKSGATEFNLEGVHELGSYLQPGYDLVVLSRNDYKRAMISVYSLTEKFILLGGMLISVSIIFAMLFSKTLTAQLQKLFDGTRDVAAGKFDLQLDVGSRDEIGALTGSFNVMSAKINHLIEDSVSKTAEKVRLENELSIASTVQQTLFPATHYQDDNIQIQSFYQSASECGGDWWGLFGTHGKLCVMIADATGHGLPSALITAAARSCFSVISKLAEEDSQFSYSPSAMLSYANRVVYEASLGKIMMTFFVGVFDFNGKTLTYSSAGHNPPWLFKRTGNTFALKSCVAQGMRLGESSDMPECEEKSMPIDAGDIFFMYTDGLIEAKDIQGEMYGKKRARKIIEPLLESGPAGVIAGLSEDFAKYNMGKPLDDDITLATMKILR